jgi:hypothetical protein
MGWSFDLKIKRRMRLKKIVFLIFLFSNLICGAQTRIQFPPLKDAVKDAGLQKFIDTLKAVVQRKDAGKMYSLVSTKIINSFDNDNGIGNFKKRWKAKKDDRLWEVMKKLLAFGGQYTYETQRHGKNEDEYVYPYFYDEQITGEQNYFDLFVVNGDSINMRRQGNTGSPVTAKLSYEVVKILNDTAHKNQAEWLYVATLDKKYKGYIKEPLLYNFIDYRMFLRKIKGIWKINILVAGD